MPDSNRPDSLRCALSVILCEGVDSNRSHATVFVHVWNHESLVATVKLLDIEQFDWPEDVAVTTVENFASTASAITRRLLDEKLYRAVQERTLHHVADYAGKPSADERHH